MPKPIRECPAGFAGRAVRLQRSIRSGSDDLKSAMTAHAIELTSGSPGPARGLPIGRRTWQLQRSLRVIPMARGRWRLQFTAPHAPYVLNPRNPAKDRGFWREMNRRARAEMLGIAARNASSP